MVDQTPIERRAAALARNQHKWIGLLPKVHQRFIERDLSRLIARLRHLEGVQALSQQRLNALRTSERRAAELEQQLAESNMRRERGMSEVRMEAQDLRKTLANLQATPATPHWWITEIGRLVRERDAYRTTLEQHTLTCEETCTVYAPRRQSFALTKTTRVVREDS